MRSLLHNGSRTASREKQFTGIRPGIMIPGSIGGLSASRRPPQEVLHAGSKTPGETEPESF
jgi:hypothetical protein